MANEWFHVAVCYDGSRQAAGVRIYYNGVQQPNAVEADKLSGTIRTAVPLMTPARYRIRELFMRMQP